MLLGRETMTNLDSVLKSKDITLLFNTLSRFVIVSLPRSMTVILLLLFYILQHLLLPWHYSIHVLTHSVLTLCNLIRYVYYYPHFTDEETKEQRCGICQETSRNGISRRASLKRTGEGITEVGQGQGVAWALGVGSHSPSVRGDRRRKQGYWMQ